LFHSLHLHVSNLYHWYEHPIYSPRNGNYKFGLIVSLSLLRLFEDHNDYIGCNVYPNRASDGQLVALEHPVHANDFFFWVY